jgi:hypothetical protein
MTRARDVADTQDNLGGAVAPYVGAKNSVINGAMDWWQRGVTFVNPNVGNYTADRYMINRSGDAAGATVSRSTSTPTGFQYAMKWQRTAANTGTQSMEIYYGLESSNSYQFAGQTATLSFYAKKGADYSGGNLNFQIASSTGTDGKPYSYTTVVASTSRALTTSYQRFSVTGTFGSSITQAFFNVSWVPTGTAGADDSVYITGIQLELGSQMTPFARAGGSIGGELALCQRYYYRQTAAETYSRFYLGNAGTTTVAQFVAPLPVTMRISPTIFEYGGSFRLYDLVNSPTAVTSLVGIGSTELSPSNTFGFNANTASGLTALRSYTLTSDNSSTAYIGVSAEL